MYICFRTDPIVVLYFEETIYGAGHYQSLIFEGDSKVKRHYALSLEQDQSRVRGEPFTSLGPGSPGFSSSKYLNTRDQLSRDMSRSRCRAMLIDYQSGIKIDRSI